MYNLQLSPEQLEIRDTVRDFVARDVKPLALRPERLEARTRPLLIDVLDKASQLGLRTLALSEDAGGAGADTLTCCIVIEELALGDPDVAAVLAQTSMLAHVLFDRLMTREQRARFLPPFLADRPLSPAHCAERAGSRCRARHPISSPGNEPMPASRPPRCARATLGHQRRQGSGRQRAAGQAVRGRGRAAAAQKRCETAQARSWCRAIRPA